MSPVTFTVFPFSFEVNKNLYFSENQMVYFDHVSSICLEKFKQTIDLCPLIAFELEIELFTFRKRFCINIVMHYRICCHIFIVSNSSSAVAGSKNVIALVPFVYSLIFFKFFQCSGWFTVEATNSGTYSLFPCETFSFLFLFFALQVFLYH